MRFRLAMGVLLAIVLAPMSGKMPAASPGQVVAAIGSQALLGFCLGLSVAILVSGVEMIGALWSTAFASASGSGWSPTDPWRELLRWSGWLAFFLVGGHRIVVRGLLELPVDPLAAAHADLAIDGLLRLVGRTLEVAWHLALPIVFSQWMAYLALAAIGRVAPTLADMHLASIVSCIVLVVGVVWAWPSTAYYSAQIVHTLVREWTLPWGDPSETVNERRLVGQPPHSQAPGGRTP